MRASEGLPQRGEATSSSHLRRQDKTRQDKAWDREERKGMQRRATGREVALFHRGGELSDVVPASPSKPRPLRVAGPPVARSVCAITLARTLFHFFPRTTLTLHCRCSSPLLPAHFNLPHDVNHVTSKAWPGNILVLTHSAFIGNKRWDQLFSLSTSLATENGEGECDTPRDTFRLGTVR